jgi:hypothetical protein
MFLENLTRFGGVQKLIVTRNTFVVTWKIKPRMSIISQVPSAHGFIQGDCPFSLQFAP